VEGPLQRLPVLVVERDDHAHSRQVGPVLLALAPEADVTKFYGIAKIPFLEIGQPR
jgi:hypothetical protein